MNKIVANARVVRTARRSFANQVQNVNWETGQPPAEGSVTECKRNV